MLQPASRLTLIDALRPPPGYVFDEAMAVTFTLDLRALLAAPAAFALARTVDPGDVVDNGTGTDDTEHAERSAEPVELLHAIRTNAGNITVFCQAGEIALPPSRRVFAFLEDSVVPVTAPRGGVVHPKVWVLRYRDAEEPERTQLRVISASRNLTFDRSWDTVVRLDSVDVDDSSSGDSATSLEPIADLFDGLADRTVGRLGDHHQARVESLGMELRFRRFALPDGVDDLVVHVLGISSGAAAKVPLPNNAERSLIISPFVSDDFCTRVHTDTIDELVSRPESLDALTDDAIARIGRPQVFDDGSTPEVGIPDSLAALDPGRPLQGLHAKVFAYETSGRAQLFCGSANATGAAFSTNVEVLLELRGSIERLGIDALCEGTSDEVGLRAMFLPHLASEPEEVDDDGSLDRLRRAIGSLAIDAHVEGSGDGWAVTYSSTEPVAGADDGVDIACWPLPSPGNRRPVVAGERLDVRFETSLEHISGFLVVEIEDAATGVSTRCVVPAQLHDVPEERDRRLLRILIGGADRFLRYLLALLADDFDDLGLVEALDQATDEHNGDANGRGAPALPVLEHLVRTLRTDPSRLSSIDPLVRDLADDDALPPGFAELWSQVFSLAAPERTT